MARTSLDDPTGDKLPYFGGTLTSGAWLIPDTCTFDQLQYAVPFPISHLITELRRRSCVNSEGIFRVSGDTVSINSLSAAYNAGLCPSLSEHSVNTIAGCLRKYFRSLAVPAITTEICVILHLLMASRFDDTNVRNFYMSQTFKIVPVPVRETLKTLFTLLSEVAANVTASRMSAAGLAVIWTANLFPSAADVAAAGAEQEPGFPPAEELNLAILCEWLIRYASEIFTEPVVVPPPVEWMQYAAAESGRSVVYPAHIPLDTTTLTNNEDDNDEAGSKERGGSRRRDSVGGRGQSSEGLCGVARHPRLPHAAFFTPFEHLSALGPSYEDLPPCYHVQPLISSFLSFDAVVADETVSQIWSDSGLPAPDLGGAQGRVFAYSIQKAPLVDDDDEKSMAAKLAELRIRMRGHGGANMRIEPAYAPPEPVETQENNEMVINGYEKDHESSNDDGEVIPAPAPAAPVPVAPAPAPAPAAPAPAQPIRAQIRSLDDLSSSDEPEDLQDDESDDSGDEFGFGGRPKARPAPVPAAPAPAPAPAAPVPAVESESDSESESESESESGSESEPDGPAPAPPSEEPYSEPEEEPASYESKVDDYEYEDIYEYEEVVVTAPAPGRAPAPARPTPAAAPAPAVAPTVAHAKPPVGNRRAARAAAAEYSDSDSDGAGPRGGRPQHLDRAAIIAAARARLAARARDESDDEESSDDRDKPVVRARAQQRRGSTSSDSSEGAPRTPPPKAQFMPARQPEPEPEPVREPTPEPEPETEVAAQPSSEPLPSPSPSPSPLPEHEPEHEHEHESSSDDAPASAPEAAPAPAPASESDSDDLGEPVARAGGRGRRAPMRRLDDDSSDSSSDDELPAPAPEDESDDEFGFARRPSSAAKVQESPSPSPSPSPAPAPVVAPAPAPVVCPWKPAPAPKVDAAPAAPADPFTAPAPAAPAAPAGGVAPVSPRRLPGAPPLAARRPTYSAPSRPQGVPSFAERQRAQSIAVNNTPAPAPAAAATTVATTVAPAAAPAAAPAPAAVAPAATSAPTPATPAPVGFIDDYDRVWGDTPFLTNEDDIALISNTDYNAGFATRPAILPPGDERASYRRLLVTNERYPKITGARLGESAWCWPPHMVTEGGWADEGAAGAPVAAPAINDYFKTYVDAYESAGRGKVARPFGVPPTVAHLVTHLLAIDAESVTGLFRIPGLKNDVTSILASYDSGILPDLGRYPVETVASALKQYFRELPERAKPMTHEVFRSFCDLMGPDYDNKEYRNYYFKYNLAALPEAEYNTMMWLFYILHRLSLHSKTGMMDGSNIAICWATNVCPSAALTTLGNSVVAWLVENYDDIFTIRRPPPKRLWPKCDPFKHETVTVTAPTTPRVEAGGRFAKNATPATPAKEEKRGIRGLFGRK